MWPADKGVTLRPACISREPSNDTQPLHWTCADLIQVFTRDLSTPPGQGESHDRCHSAWVVAVVVSNTRSGPKDTPPAWTCVQSENDDLMPRNCLETKPHPRPRIKFCSCDSAVRERARGIGSSVEVFLLAHFSLFRLIGNVKFWQQPLIMTRWERTSII